ncbi:hypothetical protein [Rhizobium sp. L1K21]|uniref:hypothetical protein n=1 Tax=Rhizobium sp. L1K21 TaxID=2954933 RepID=UPI002093A370|nr:hypothetical protein [Rhizobium sp. L1K21]MCO6186643.1 hypothetical protein [Rhizobium sp. L1K21]
MNQKSADKIELIAKEMFLDWLLSLPIDVDPFMAASDEIQRIESLESPQLLDQELKQLFCQMAPVPRELRDRRVRSLH